MAGLVPEYNVVVTYTGGVCITTVPGCESLFGIVKVVGLVPVYYVVVT